MLITHDCDVEQYGEVNGFCHHSGNRREQRTTVTAVISQRQITDVNGNQDLSLLPLGTCRYARAFSGVGRVTANNLVRTASHVLYTQYSFTTVVTGT